MKFFKDILLQRRIDTLIFEFSTASEARHLVPNELHEAEHTVSAATLRLHPKPAALLARYTNQALSISTVKLLPDLQTKI